MTVPPTLGTASARVEVTVSLLPRPSPLSLVHPGGPALLPWRVLSALLPLPTICLAVQMVFFEAWDF